MKKIIALLVVAVILTACSKPKTRYIDYRSISMTQNELILTQEEKIEELATVIQQTMPAYKVDYHDIDSLNYILDSIYLVTI